MNRIFSRLGWAVGWVTAFGALAYLFLYIYRWEWHRALVAGIVLVAVEVALTGALLLRRLGRVDSPGDTTPSLTGDRADRLVPHDFAWLDPRRERYGVFIPLLLGGGVMVSGLAWAIEKITGGLSTSSDTGGLPDGYEDITCPNGSLVPSDDEVRIRGLPAADDEHLRRLLGPYARRGIRR